MQTILQIVLFFVCLHGLMISLNANNWCLHKETFGKFNVTTDCQLQYEIAIVVLHGDKKGKTEAETPKTIRVTITGLPNDSEEED